MNNKIDVLQDAVKVLSNILDAQAKEELQSLVTTQLNVLDVGVNFYVEVRRFEIELIMRALKFAKGRQTEAASLLHINPSTLNSKIKAYNIDYRGFT